MVSSAGFADLKISDHCTALFLERIQLTFEPSGEGRGVERD